MRKDTVAKTRRHTMISMSAESIIPILAITLGQPNVQESRSYNCCGDDGGGEKLVVGM